MIEATYYVTDYIARAFKSKCIGDMSCKYAWAYLQVHIVLKLQCVYQPRDIIGYLS